MRGYRVAIVGATGAVGREFLTLFEERSFPVEGLKLIASSRSAGQELECLGRAHPVEVVDSSTFEDVDIAFFSAGASRSRELAPQAIQAGALVVDNSSAFRMDPEVPLVIPEINPHAITDSTRVVANPNCTAIVLLMAIAPLRKHGTIRRLIVSTYQSASGGGAAMMQELETQTRAVLAGESPTPQVAPHTYAFNLFSHNTPINEHGYNEEEWKVIQETRKILERPDLLVNVTCIRVPVMRAHSESITVEFDGAAPDPEEVRKTLAAAPGVRVVDHAHENHFPMPIEATGQNDVLVGRIRRDLSHPNALCLFVSGDQLRKGAALNAIQIAELMAQRGLLPLRAGV
jgi:aspartate-semialdehyde dehydrogenase